MAYAQDTLVSAEKSRGDIEQLVQKYAGRDSDFSYGRAAGQASVMFTAKGRRIQFTLPMPTKEEATIGAKRKNGVKPATPVQIETWLEQETRRRWRCLYLIIKAKFVAVDIWEELGDPATNKDAFEREFLSHITSTSGQSIYSMIQNMTAEGHKLLPALEEPKRKK